MNTIPDDDDDVIFPTQEAFDAWKRERRQWEEDEPVDDGPPTLAQVKPQLH
jgi:hypothetical protein